VADVVPPSTALAFVTKMSEKCKFTSSSAIQVKIGWETISVEGKLDVISWLGERMLDIRHSCLSTIGDNADRITESANWATEVFV